MTIKEAQNKFINAWGTLGSQWGINRTMAQIHATLMVSTESLTTDDIMERLSISRGNANMNLRALMDWGIVFKEYRRGERKDYYYAEKDVYRIARQITKERRRREIEPVIEVLEDLQKTNIKDSEEGRLFKKSTGDLLRFVKRADKLAEVIGKADENWFTGKLMKFLK